MNARSPWNRAALAAFAVAASVLVGCNRTDREPVPPSPVVGKNVLLVGAQENPPVTTAATGSGSFLVDTVTGAVSGTVTTFGLTGSAAHIHEGAVGVNAPVIVPLMQSTPGTWQVPGGAVLSPAQLQSFRNGNLYVNVHSTANPGGEIRAQIGRQVFFATLAGAQEVPPVNTGASGQGRFVFDPDTRTLSGSVTTTGMAGTVAHLHTAVAGVAGPVTIPLAGGPIDWQLAPTVLTETQAGDLLAGRFYANVHTAANPGGEIRGQLFSTVARATLSGANEVPPNDSTATGVGWLSVNPATKAVAGRIESTLTNATAAHVHRGAPTCACPVVIPMTSPAPGVWVIPAGATISDELIAALLKGELYYNVHTPTRPGGEIRGTLMPAL